MYIINILLNNTDLLLDIFYISTIFCGLSILIYKNAIISIIYFMLVYVTSSLYLYYAGYNGMPLLIILIYVGAIAILFLFILTLINVKEQEDQYRYVTRNNNNLILIYINILILLLIYLYSSSNDNIIGSQLYNILDKILLFNYFNNDSIDLLNISSIGSNNIIHDTNIYFNISLLDYPIQNLSEVHIIGQNMYTIYAILLLILGLILILSIISAIAILFQTHNCLVAKTNI